MRREILYRAKRSDTNEWAFGVVHFNGKYIIPNKYENNYNDWAEIIEGTEGQYIGLCDKNSQKIFEGDIVVYYQPYSGKWCVHEVRYDKHFACFGLFEDGNDWCIESDWMKIQEIEVISNISNKTIKPQQNDFGIDVNDVVKINKICYNNIALDIKEEYFCFNFIIKLKSGIEITFLAKSRECDFSIIQKKIDGNTKDVRYIVMDDGVSQLKNVYRDMYNKVHFNE